MTGVQTCALPIYILLFHRLKRSEMGRIVDIQFTRLQKLVADRRIALDLEPSAREWLADRGYDPAYGARPLKRVIQREVQDPLAEKILMGQVGEGARVRVVAGGDRLQFEVGEDTAAAA